MTLSGADIRIDGDDAAAAHAEDGNGNVVVAGIEGKVRPDKAGDLHDIAHIPGGLLDPGDVGVFTQLLHHGHGDGAARPPRHIVEDAGNLHGVRRLYEVAEHPLRIGLVVVGGDEEQGVRAHGLVAEAHLLLGGGTVGAAAHHDGDAPVDGPNGPFHHGGVLLMGHGGVLPGGAQNENAVGSRLDLPFQQKVQGVEIHRAVLFPEGRDHGDNGSLQMVKFHILSPPWNIFTRDFLRGLSQCFPQAVSVPLFWLPRSGAPPFPEKTNNRRA